LDRVTDVLEGAFARMPALMEVGIHTIVNGPITYTIDGAPLVGPIPGKRNAFCIIGLRAGLGEGGGHGWLLAQQIVHGEACYDTWSLDPRRFTGHGNVELTALKAIEDYQNEFRFHFPHEHRPAGRPAKTTPLTPVLAAEGAEFGVVNGWERVDYFRPSEEFEETHGFRFNEVHAVVAEEVRAVQEGVGLTEVNGFNRFEITGAASEFHDMDWLSTHVAEDEDVTIRSLTNDMTILVLAGPKARDVLSVVSREDWSAAAFPWLSVREAFVGIAPATIMSVSFSGELAFEIHVPNAQLYAAYLALRSAGEAHGLRLFGSRAIESMRMEKGYLHWKSDILTEFDPLETGLDRFVRMQKGDFIGKAALETRLKAGPQKKRVTLSINCDDRPAHGGASVMLEGKLVGTVTSGDWGHRTGLNLAYAFVQPGLAAVGTKLSVDLLGDVISAQVIPAEPYDPDNSLPRG